MIRFFKQPTRLPADLLGAPTASKGLYFRPVEREEFNKFILLYATSPETGRIGTVFDKKEAAQPDQIIRTLGLFGCGRLCAVAVCVIVPNKSDSHNSCRLDTVVADNTLRKQGLATFVITTLFMGLLTERELDISRMFSYAVHPGTVAILKKLHFSSPPPKGAPLVAVEIKNNDENKVLSSCQTLFGTINTQLQDTCTNCAGTAPMNQRWCEAEASATNWTSR